MSRALYYVIVHASLDCSVATDLNIRPYPTIFPKDEDSDTLHPHLAEVLQVMGTEFP